MSRFSGTLLLLAPLIALLGCASSQHKANEKYFLLAPTLKIPYWQQASSGLVKAAAQMRVNAEAVAPDAYDPKSQHEKFQDVLKQKPTGILVSVSDPKLMSADIDAAIAQGIPVITIDADAPASKRLMFIGTDNYRVGVTGGALAAKQLKFRGSVVFYSMPEQTNLGERLRGYKDVFENYPQIKILDVIDVRGGPSVAFDKTMDLIDKGAKVDAFVCLVSAACPEVAEVLDRKHVSGKTVVAMDTDPRTLEAIRKGTILATIGQKPFTMAFFALKLLDDLYHHPLPSLTRFWAQDSFAPIPVFVDTGATLIDQDNVDRFIQAQASAAGS